MSISLGGLNTQVAAKLPLSGGIVTGSLSSNSAITAATIGNASTVLYGNAAALSGIVAAGPTITSVSITDSAGVVLDDTALSTTGGYIKIVGSGFGAGAVVLIGTTVATSTTVLSSTQVLAQLGGASGTKDVFIVNTDGTAAVKPLAITYSPFPAWSTSAALTGVTKTVAFSQTLSASSDSSVTYSLDTGSSLPAGTALTTGVLSGTISETSTSDTTYSFTVQATDAENQNTPQTFSLIAGAFATRKLTASDKAANDGFGKSVAFSGDGTRVVVGAPYSNPGGTVDAGAAYIYSRSGTVWTEEAKIVASDKVASDWFGTSVSMSNDGSRVVVGVIFSDPGAFVSAGAAYIYSRSGTVWTQEAKIIASDKLAGDNFGVSVSFSGDGTRVVVGANGSDTGGSDTGAAYIYSRSGTVWSQEAKIQASDKAVNDYFGTSVSISSDGSRVVVGAYASDPGGTSGAGAAYVFSRSGTIWTQEAKIFASDKAVDVYSGQSVSLSNDGTRVVVGAYYSDPGGTVDAGAAYIFSKSGTVWTQEAKIIASDKAASDFFGWSVSISSDGTRVVVGAHFSDPGGTSNAGAAYIFSRSGTTWTEESKIFASDKVAIDYFGTIVSISNDGTRVVVGADGSDPGGTAGAGAAYIFTRAGTTWTTAM